MRMRDGGDLAKHPGLDSACSRLAPDSPSFRIKSLSGGPYVIRNPGCMTALRGNNREVTWLRPSKYFG